MASSWGRFEAEVKTLPWLCTLHIKVTSHNISAQQSQQLRIEKQKSKCNNFGHAPCNQNCPDLLNFRLQKCQFSKQIYLSVQHIGSHQSCPDISERFQFFKNFDFFWHFYTRRLLKTLKIIIAITYTLDAHFIFRAGRVKVNRTSTYI